MTPAEELAALRRLAELEAKEKSRGSENGVARGVTRKAGLAAKGLSDSVMETLGAIPDLAAKGLREIHPALAPEDPRFYTNALKSGYETVGDALTAPVRGALPDYGSAIPETAGEKFAYGVGHGVGEAASVILPAAGVARVAQAGGLPSRVANVMRSQPVAQMTAGSVGGGVGSASDNPYLGLAAGLATPYAVSGARRLVTPVRPQLNPEQARLAATAEANGIRLTPAQQTGSRPLQYLESVFGDLPLTSRHQRAISDAQHAGFNRMALREAGVNSNSAAPDVIDNAFRALGQQFDDLAAQTTIRVDRGWFDDVQRVAADYARRLPTDVRPVFRSYVDDIMQARAAMNQPGVTSVSIDGTAYQNMASGLRAAARGAKSRPELQRALNGLVESVDDMMTRSMGPEVSAQWGETRRQYRNLLAIDDAMSSGTQASRSGGDIPYAGLKAAVKKQDPRGFSRGRGDLNDAARVGDFLGTTQPPNSGTPTRTLIQNLLTGGAGGGGAAGLMMGDPVLAAGSVGGAIVGPRLAQMLYNSAPSQRYLTNQMLPASPVEASMLARILMGQGREPAVNAAVR